MKMPNGTGTSHHSPLGHPARVCRPRCADGPLAKAALDFVRKRRGGAGGGEEPLSEDFLIHPVLPQTIHKGTLCLEPSSVHPGPMCVHTCAYTHTHTH